MFARINSLGLLGLNAFPVTVEIESSTGMPAFDIVGLADAAVRESRERIRSAFRCSKITFPTHKILINLAPADVKKTGSVHDLAIAVALLAAAGVAGKTNLDKSVFIGEVALNGEIRHISGVLPMVILAQKMGMKKIYVPKDNIKEASVVKGIECYGVESLGELVLHLTEQVLIPSESSYKPKENDYFGTLDFADVKGQYAAKKALETAAAGGHNALLLGHNAKAV